VSRVVRAPHHNRATIAWWRRSSLHPSGPARGADRAARSSFASAPSAAAATSGTRLSAWCT